MKSKLRTGKNFTLIELLVVIAIITITSRSKPYVYLPMLSSGSFWALGRQ